MIRGKNILCFFRSIDIRNAGKMVSDEGREVKWDKGFKLELDIYDPEEDLQKNKLKTCTIVLEDNETNAEYYEKLRYMLPMTQIYVDLNVVLPKREDGRVKINLDRIVFQETQKQK